MLHYHGCKTDEKIDALIYSLVPFHFYHSVTQSNHAFLSTAARMWWQQFESQSGEQATELHQQQWSRSISSAFSLSQHLQENVFHLGMLTYFLNYKWHSNPNSKALSHILQGLTQKTV